MAKLVFSLIVFIAATTCSLAHTTVREMCQDVCPICGDFLKGHESVPPFVTDWLKENDYWREDKWDCEHLQNVIVGFVTKVRKIREDKDEEKAKELNKKLEEAMSCMAESLVNTIVEKSSDGCKDKVNEVWSHIM